MGSTGLLTFLSSDDGKDELAGIGGPARASALWAKYGTRTEAESAREMPAARMEQATAPSPSVPDEPELEHVPLPRRSPKPRTPKNADDLGDILRSPEAKRLQKEVMRGVFGMR